FSGILLNQLILRGPNHNHRGLHPSNVVDGKALPTCSDDTDQLQGVPCSSEQTCLRMRFETPPYTYDLRGKHSETASHWKDKEILDERGYFRTITEPATLSLDNVDERDEGEYRCRVDFKQAPTRNSRVRLTVISKYR
ncbi:hypothetical protein L9F63_003454, partial [Diploptera punctata]